MNKTISLVRYAQTPKGWRRGAVVIGKTKRLKPDVMILAGVEVECPNGRYQLLRYDGAKPVYDNLGNDPTEALARFRTEEAKSKARVAAIDAGLEVSSPAEGRRSLKQYAADFLDMHRDLPHRSDDSIKAYTLITTTFIAACKATYPEKVTQEDVVRWAGRLREQGYSDRSRSNYYTSLRGFLSYCGVDASKIVDKGTHKLLKKYTKKMPDMYTTEQVQALMAASLDSNRALLWDFLYKTGLRDGEIQYVSRYDLFDLDGNRPIVRVRERDLVNQIKDSEEREIELHPSLVAPLKQWLEENPTKTLVFGTASDLPDDKMLKALKSAARRAGLNCGQCKGCRSAKNECGQYTIHKFRRTYTTKALKACRGDFRAVMARTGHSDIQTLTRYLAPDTNFRDAIAAAF